MYAAVAVLAWAAAGCQLYLLKRIYDEHRRNTRLLARLKEFANRNTYLDAQLTSKN